MAGSMPKPPSLATVLADIEERLFAETPRAVRRAVAKWKSPPWCCALVFDGSQSPWLPPEIALTTVGERDACLPRRARSRRSASGTPSRSREWARDGTRTRSSSRRRDGERALEEKDDASPVAKLLTRVAKRLNALSESSFGAVSDDFVVYALDRNELATTLVAASLTTKKAAALKQLRVL